MHSIEQGMPDADRRDAALERVLVDVESARVDLSPSELLVLRAVSHGLTEAEAAELLGWSRNAVHDQAQNARRILAAKSTLHAVAIALRLKLIA